MWNKKRDDRKRKWDRHSLLDHHGAFVTADLKWHWHITLSIRIQSWCCTSWLWTNGWRPVFTTVAMHRVDALSQVFWEFPLLLSPPLPPPPWLLESRPVFYFIHTCTFPRMSHSRDNTAPWPSRRLSGSIIDLDVTLNLHTFQGRASETFNKYLWNVWTTY